MASFMESEALARWTDPVLGDIPPGKFIALAEETGEIEAIGRWTLHEACRQMAEWRNNGIEVPVVSVNLSPINFYNSSLPNYISYLLRQYRIPASCLTIEITEGGDDGQATGNDGSDLRRARVRRWVVDG